MSLVPHLPAYPYMWIETAYMVHDQDQLPKQYKGSGFWSKEEILAVVEMLFLTNMLKNRMGSSSFDLAFSSELPFRSPLAHFLHLIWSGETQISHDIHKCFDR